MATAKLTKKTLIIVFLILSITTLGFFVFFNFSKDDTVSSIGQDIVTLAGEKCGDFFQNVIEIDNINRAESSFIWFTEESAFLLNGEIYIFNHYNLDNIDSAAYLECFRKATKEHLTKNGFSYNSENSYEEWSEAFEKDNIKISTIKEDFFENLHLLLIGDKNNTTNIDNLTAKEYWSVISYLYYGDNNSIPGRNLNPAYRLIPGESKDNFFEFYGDRTSVIIKKENESWRFITHVGPDAPSCEPVLEENIPPLLIDSCWTDNGNLLIYNEEKESWEIR